MGFIDCVWAWFGLLFTSYDSHVFHHHHHLQPSLCDQAIERVHQRLIFLRPEQIAAFARRHEEAQAREAQAREADGGGVGGGGGDGGSGDGSGGGGDGGSGDGGNGGGGGDGGSGDGGSGGGGGE